MLWTIGDPRANQRVDSWKEIASFFRRDERTVKRWEKSKFLPVHRIPGGERGGVFAYTHELTEWLNTPLPAKASLQAQRDRHRLETILVRPVEVKLSPVVHEKLVARKSNGTPAPQAMALAKPAAETVARTGRSCSIYKKQRSGDRLSYSFVRQAELFGWSAAWNRGGWLPHLVHQHIQESSAEIGPAWRINCDEIRLALGTGEDKPGSRALVIEICPDKATVLLCEIMELWGFSSDGWTSMMLRLKRLASGNPEAINALQFSVNENHHDAGQSTLMMTCTPDGSIRDGKVAGKWPQPASGLLNSAWLCPSAFSYFACEATKIMPAGELSASVSR